MSTEDMCHCGLPLHYTDNKFKTMVDEMVKNYGSTIEVVSMDKTYRVPRHFIALHGLNSIDLDSLGFNV
jgi:hypothetical protein